MSKVKKILLILIHIFIFFDQLSKKWMLNNIFDSQRIIEINKYLNFVPVWNKGISFGMLSDVMNINFFMITSSICLIILRRLMLLVFFLKIEIRSFFYNKMDFSNNVEIYKLLNLINIY